MFSFLVRKGCDENSYTGNTDYSTARTPYIQSQLVGGTRYNLFRVYTRSHGSDINKSYAPIANVTKIASTVGAAKTFYKLSIDSGYDRDIRVNGSTYGTFKVQPKTRVIGQVSSGSTVFDVDSTVGFAHSGELSVVYNDDSVGVVSYTSKSLTQFYGCSNISEVILDASNIGINTSAYGYSFLDQNELIQVRINSVLSSLEYPDNTVYLSAGDTANIKTLGVLDDTFKAKNWIYNNSYSNIYFILV